MPAALAPMMLEKTAKIAHEPAPILRLAPVEAQDLPTLEHLLDRLTRRTDWRIEAGSPTPALTFGGPELDAFPPLAVFAAPEEVPSRRLQRILLVGEAGLPSLPKLAPVQAMTVSEDMPLGALDESLAPADLVVTSARRVAAYANGWLKPAILVSQRPVHVPWPCLPFTLVGIESQAFGLAQRFDLAAAMPDLLNWKRQAVQRLAIQLRRLSRDSRP